MAAEINEQTINAIVQEVLRNIRAGAQSAGPVSAPPVAPLGQARPRAGGHSGVFERVEDAIDAAEVAQRQLLELSLEKRGQLIQAMRDVGVAQAEALAKAAREETRMGRFEHKVLKNVNAARNTPGLEDLDTKAYSGDHGLAVVEMAPYGVIGAVTPVTNPTSTIINNGICMIAAGNSVVFSPHPTAKRSTNRAVEVMNQAIVSAGGPPNLLTSVAEPSLESAETLFHHPKIRLLVAIGGAGVVRAAMTSGKKCIAAGPGNPPVVVDESADLRQAARDIVDGASFDNNLLCTCEKEIFCVDSVADQLKRHMLEAGAYELKGQKFDELVSKVLIAPSKPGEHWLPNRDFVGKDARELLTAVGISVGDDVKLVFGESRADHALVVCEQMMPFLPFVRVRDVEEGIQQALKAEHGFAHTAVMHSLSVPNLSNMARRMNTTIFVKNGPSSAGDGVGGEGFTTMTVAGPTGEGLTSPRSFTRQRRCVMVDYFRIV